MQSLNSEETQFVIAGHVESERPTYYSMINGWTDDFTEATTFPRDIINLPPPPGATMFIEMDMDGELIGTMALPRGGV